nr:ribonuclease H-like domain-containing protein [Tanacetum cinerariifolium]
MTINEYCTKIKYMADRLKNLGCVVSDKNLVIYTVNRLDSRFATLVEIIRHRETLPTLETTRTMLLLKNHRSPMTPGPPPLLRVACHLLPSADLYPVTKPSTLPAAFVSASSTTWQQRLGHPENEVLRSLSSVRFISCNKVTFTHVCHACQLGKRVKLPFHSSNSLVKHSCDIIHSDLWTSQIIVDSLHKEFDMTDLEALNYFLGISAVRHPTGLFLSQKKYALQLLERAHMANYNPSRTPVDTDTKLGPDDVPVQDPTLYRNLAGGFSILHLLAQIFHMQFNRSTSGYCVFLETAWIRNLLRELHSPLLTATRVYCDNAGHVRVFHVSSNFQYAEIFTKGLPSALFEDFWSNLSIRPPPT